MFFLMGDVIKSILFDQTAFWAKHFNLIQKEQFVFSRRKWHVFHNLGKNVLISPLHISSRRGIYCFLFS